ncbi:hypothetical protein I79_006221 [Cricetulus griseus]|uniref:Uncharacterized protein n=1 Tax=Cricetulus griseus TaxID=10029 RepID=G3H792_CRIGR|nr:hypothetical protein I79_006221 [Cricetulus griseus]
MQQQYSWKGGRREFTGGAAALADVACAFALGHLGFAVSTTWVPGTVLTPALHFLMFDVLSSGYELKGIWGCEVGRGVVCRKHLSQMRDKAD